MSRLTYDAWGNILSSTGTLANANPIRYRGYYFDTETGLYYLHSRYYDPQTGRFINADDASNLGANSDFASANLFAYCGNNPVSRKDGEGQIWNAIVGAVVGGVIGGASAVINSIIKGEEANISTFVRGALVGAVSGVVTALLPCVGINSRSISAVVSGGVTYVGSRLSGNSVEEAAVSAAAAAASTYLTMGLASSIPKSSSDLETAVAKGIVGFYTSGSIEGLFSVGRGASHSFSNSISTNTKSNVMFSMSIKPCISAMAY